MAVNHHHFYHSLFPETIFVGKQNPRFFLDLRKTSVPITKHGLPKIIFQNLDFVLQKRFPKLLTDINFNVLRAKFYWASKCTAKFTEKPLLLFFEDLGFAPLRIAPYSEIKNFVMVTARIPLLVVTDVKLFNIIDCRALVEFGGSFTDIELLEKTLSLMPNLTILEVVGFLMKTTIAEISDFERMTRAVSKLSKLEFLKISWLDIPAGWEDAFCSQKYEKCLTKIFIVLHQENCITHDETNRQKLNEKFTVEITHTSLTLNS